MPSASTDPSKAPGILCARRVKKGDRVVILPPAGYGNVWVGGTRHTSTAKG